MRLARVIEGSQTVALLVAAEHLARSPGGVTIVLETPAGIVTRDLGPVHVRRRCDACCADIARAAR